MNNKLKIAVILISIFLFGLFIGYLVHLTFPIRAFHHFGPPPKHFKHKKSLSQRFSKLFTERLLREINPNEDQKEKVTNIIKKFEDRFIENNDTHMENMINMFKEMEKELDPILTNDQKSKIREKLERMEEGFFRHLKFKSKKINYLE